MEGVKKGQKDELGKGQKIDIATWKLILYSFPIFLSRQPNFPRSREREREKRKPLARSKGKNRAAISA